MNNKKTSDAVGRGEMERFRKREQRMRAEGGGDGVVVRADGDRL